MFFKKNLTTLLFLLSFILVNKDLRATFDSGNAQAIGLQSDGTIVAAGNAQIDNNAEIGIARYTTSGQLDLTYGNNGFVTTILGTTQVNANALLIDSNNNSVIVGSGIVNGVSELLIARFDTSGNLDNTFGTGGTTFTAFGDGANGNGLVMQDDGSLVVAGAVVVNGTPEILVARYTSDGILDTSFGSNGSTIVEVGNISASNAIAIQSNQQIITGGFSVINGLQSFVLVRLNTDGSLDSNFGNNGVVSTPTGLGDEAYSLVLQSNGQIIVGGSSGNNFGLVRYNADGSVDTSFGNNGIVIQPIGSYAQINGIALQENGQIIAAGFSDSYFAVARFNTDGSIDTNFGSVGYVTTVLAGPDAAQGVVIQSDGQIVAAGSAGSNYGLARYNTDGSLDTTFGVQGIVIAPNNAGADIYGITDINIDEYANIAYSKLNLSNSIMDSDINVNAGIEDTKLGIIQTPGKVLNQATSATNLNTAGAIVARDAVGSFYANRVYATLQGSVLGTASGNLLKAGDTMTGSLILPAGTPNVPSLQFSGSTNSGLSSVSNTLTLSTNGAGYLSINPSGNVAVGAPLSGVGLAVNGGGESVVGDITTTGDLIFNTANETLYALGSPQNSFVKVFTGSANTGLSGSVTIDYTAAGFANAPLIFTQVMGGAVGSLSVASVGSTSAVVGNSALINTNFNYVAIGS